MTTEQELHRIAQKFVAGEIDADNAQALAQLHLLNGILHELEQIRIETGTAVRVWLEQDDSS